MYKEGFWIEKPIGNNVFCWDKRLEKGMDRNIFVPGLKMGNIEDVKIGENPVFVEKSNDGEIKEFVGLENFVEIENGEQKIFVLDNHNHALFFWAREILDRNNNLNFGTPVIHIDQHSDINEVELGKFEEKENLDLKDWFEITNFVCNVGNFLTAGQKLGLVGNVEQVRTEYKLLNFECLECDFILDIDLDFWAPEMGIENYEKTILAAKKLLKKAKIVTIATSPYFLKQELGMKIFKDLI